KPGLKAGVEVFEALLVMRRCPLNFQLLRKRGHLSFADEVLLHEVEAALQHLTLPLQFLSCPFRVIAAETSGWRLGGCPGVVARARHRRRSIIQDRKYLSFSHR